MPNDVEWTELYKFLPSRSVRPSDEKLEAAFGEFYGERVNLDSRMPNARSTANLTIWRRPTDGPETGRRCVDAAASDVAEAR